MSQVEPLDLVFKNLSYFVKDPVESKKQKKEVKKTILKDLTGYFMHGTLTGIMGPSGAGKTSLMEVISNQSKSGEVHGDFFLNGNEVNIKNIKQNAGFVFQDDVILRTMTVYEALLMSATLRLPESVSFIDKTNIVNEMISTLHLNKCKDTIVGDSTLKGLSGGERKRLSVGMEMITNPSIIFLDEPTSGLDTYTAYTLIESLKNLALSGRTVICTIHQPSSDIFRLFNRMILLNQGKIIYQGEVDNIVKYFDNLGYKCPQYTNPSDFLFMNILNKEYYINNNDNNDENNNIIVDQSNEQNITNSNISKPRLTIQEKDDLILDSYKKTGMEDNVKKKCNDIISNAGHFSKKMKKFIPKVGVQYKFLFKRHLKNVFRDKRIIRLKIAQSFGLGLLIGLTFFNIPGSDKDNQKQDRVGGLFISSFSQVLLPMMGTLSIFSSETPVVIREISSGYYTAFGYYFSKITFEIPFQLFITSIACTIIYFLSNYQCTFMKFLKFLGTIELGALCGLSLGLTIATIAKNIAIALQFAPFLVITMIIYSGLLINVDSIPVYFTWLQYVFPVRYMYQEVVKNEFYDLDVNDSEDAVLDMSFDNLSSVLSILILAFIALFLYIFCYLMLYVSIKNSLSKTKYISSKGEDNTIKSNELNEPLLYND